MNFIKELFEFLKIRKKYWLLPIILVLFFSIGLIILTQGNVVAPCSPDCLPSTIYRATQTAKSQEQP